MLKLNSLNPTIEEISKNAAGNRKIHHLKSGATQNTLVWKK